MQPNPAPHPAPHPIGQRESTRGTRRTLDPGRTLLGLVVLTVGVLYLLDSMGVLDAGEVVGRWWPAAIVAAGLLQLAERRGSSVGPLIVTGAGALLLLDSTNAIEGNAWNYVWPLAIVAVGAGILLGRPRAVIPTGAATDDTVTATGVFGEPKIRTQSKQFRHASLTAFFGGVTLDLRDALPDPSGATITATVAFGGIHVLVPRGWRIVVNGTPIFGGIADKTEPVTALAPEAPALQVNGLALFGGIEIKN
jgi:LiaF transmembrane domain/Cell wall-active antibiotics response LiaF, C-terminal